VPRRTLGDSILAGVQLTW